MKEEDEAKDPENRGENMRALFDMEEGIEETIPRYKVLLGELLDRIIEKRLEYYIPVEDDEEDEEVPYRTFPRENE